MFELQDIVNDINNSKNVLKSTMNVYFQELKSNFIDSLNLIEKQEITGEVKDKICIHLLASNELAEGHKGKKLRRICQGTVMKSIFKNSNLMIKFDDYIDQEGNFKAPFEVRNCLYNNFMREVHLRERFKPSQKSR